MSEFPKGLHAAEYCQTTGKIRHPSRHAAKKHQKCLRRKNGHTYRCPHCGGWHMSSQEARGR